MYTLAKLLKMLLTKNWQRRFERLIWTMVVFYPIVVSAHTVSGTISDAVTGEKLPGAMILWGNNGIVSNAYGFYSATVKDNSVTFSYSYMGFDKKVLSVSLHTDTVINVSLQPLSYGLKEVTVSGNKSMTANAMGTQKIDIGTIKKIPAVAGETDVLRSLQSLPGVAVANEGTNSFSVRGGSYAQNLIILDEAVLYNPNHALSFISTFNPDAVQSAEIIKSAFPAKYGSRLSSVVNVQMRDGNNQEYKVNGGIGLISSRLSVEGPLKRGESSFIVSGRYSYAGQIANLVSGLNSIANIPELYNLRSGNEVNFYDFNGKANFKLNDRNRIYLSLYSGKDHFYLKCFSDNYSMDWGNNAAVLRLNSILSPRLFTNTTLACSNYSYSYYLKADARNFLWEAGMTNLQFRTDAEHSLTDKLMAKYGLTAGYLHISPGTVTPYNRESVIKASSLQKRNSVEVAAYAEGSFSLNSSLSIKAGMRLAMSSSLKSQLPVQPDDFSSSMSFYPAKTYWQPEPRLLVNYSLTELSSLKMSYSKMHQNLHLLSNSNVGMPTDMWTSADSKIKPESSDQMSIGYYRDSRNNMFDSFVEVYYKKMNGVVDFIDNADIFMNGDLSSQIKAGISRSYGIELFVHKKTGRVKGWLSYTLSKTWNNIDGINNNLSYPAAFDKRHNLRLILYCDLSPKYTLSASFAYASGSNLTVPTGTFEYYGASFNYYSSRNGYKVPPFHEMNVSLTRRSSTKRKWRSEWIFAINNIYNRHNVFSIYTRSDEHYLAKAKTSMLYLYGILPSVTYNFTF